MPILDFFPLSVPRPKQVRALEYIEKVVGLGYRDVVISGPCGLGKSAIGATVCAWAVTQNQLKYKAGGYALVMQKVLQDQIANELDALGGKTTAALIKSAVEYKCPTHRACSIGRLRKCELCRTGCCTYKLAKERFINAAYAVTNYPYFWTERYHVGELEPRRALICDECGNLATHITRFVEVQISEDKLVDYAPLLEDTNLRQFTEASDFLKWVTKTYLPSVKEQVEILAALADGTSADDETLKLAFEVEQHYIKTKNAVEEYQRNPFDWVYWKTEEEGAPVVLTLRPIEAAPYFTEMLGKASDLRIYMSAYPGSKAVFCRELGLKPDRVAWLSLASSFPVENRPVILATVGSLSRTNVQQNLPSALRMVEKIANRHPERGLIHTNSYALAKEVVAFLAKTAHASRVIFPDEADKREAAILKHKGQKGAILISPSIAEGFDFKDDAARWQIVLKTPFRSLSDRQTVVKAERSPEWYKLEAFKTLLQACGRICRTETDTGVTYLLDEDSKRLLAEVDQHIPKWFKDSIIYP
jgi:Rad3-related DNA helicase